MSYITNKDETYWIKELKNKHKNDILYKSISIIFFFIFFLLFLLAFPLALLPDDFIYVEIIAFTITIGTVSTFLILLKFHYNYLNIDCLGYFLYKIGSNLDNFNDSDYYYKTNHVFIKKSMKIIRHYKPYKQNVFSNNTLDFFNNLELICLRLNFLFSNECDHTTFTETKKNISTDIMKLGGLIKNKQSHLSPTHTETITKILHILVDVPEKTFEHQTIHINIQQPYFFKVIEFSVIVFLLTFFGSIKFVEYFIEPDLISYNTIMLFSGTILASFLLQINHIIKK